MSLNPWRLVPGSDVRFRFWGDESVVYNTLSGDTHLIGSAAAHILLELQKVSATSVTLTETLASLMHVEIDDEFASQIKQILTDLQNLSLIEQTRF